MQYLHAPTAEHHAKVTNRGGALHRELGLVKGGYYSIPAYVLEDLANDPEVAFISPNRSLKGSLDNTTAAVNAATAWTAGYTGAGIGIAVIDSGITSNGDLAQSRLVYSQSWVNNDPHDSYGHGTHVAGIIGGTGYRSHCAQCTRNLQGLAPRSEYH